MVRYVKIGVNLRHSTLPRRCLYPTQKAREEREVPPVPGPSRNIGVFAIYRRGFTSSAVTLSLYLLPKWVRM